MILDIPRQVCMLFCYILFLIITNTVWWHLFIPNLPIKLIENTLHFLNKKFMIEELEKTWDGSDWINFNRWICSYDTNNNKVEELKHD